MNRIIPDKATDQQIDLPSSKSLTHRLLILAALNEGTTKIQRPLASEDTSITQSALRQMGGGIDITQDGITISQPIGKCRETEIYLGNSGSSARFLIPLGAFLDKPIRYSGTERLHQRPFTELLTVLQILGHRLEPTGKSLPLVAFPGVSTGGEVQLGELPSSQIVTALMMSALRMEKDLVIRLPENMPSLPYIRMTANLMKRLRLNLEYSDREIWVEAQIPKMDWLVTVEKDYSAASYWVVYALINGVNLVLNGMNLPSLQGDEAILQMAEEAGAEIMLYGDRVEIKGQITRALDLDCEATPDLVPALSVLSLFTNSTCRLRNVKLLEYKESNRIQAIQENLLRIGGKSDYKNGDLYIYPQSKYHGNQIDTFNDHRIAMSFAVAGTRIPGMIIENPACVDKSYPRFWQDFPYWEKISGDDTDVN